MEKPNQPNAVMERARTILPFFTKPDFLADLLNFQYANGSKRIEPENIQLLNTPSFEEVYWTLAGKQPALDRITAWIHLPAEKGGDNQQIRIRTILYNEEGEDLLNSWKCWKEAEPSGNPCSPPIQNSPML